MTLLAQPWLPPPARGEAEAAVAKLAERWLADWLVDTTGPGVSIVPSGPEPSPWHGPAGARVAADAAARIALGRAACGGHGNPDNPSDRRIFGAVAAAMLVDIAEQASGGQDVGIGSESNRFAVVAEDRSWSIVLELGEVALVRLRKAAAGSVRRPVTAPIAAALADEEVQLGCHLGAARISAGDASALCSGDLIVLDRDHSDGVPLTVSGIAARRGSARIAAADGAIRVTIAEPLGLEQKG